MDYYSHGTVIENWKNCSIFICVLAIEIVNI